MAAFGCNIVHRKQWLQYHITPTPFPLKGARTNNRSTPCAKVETVLGRPIDPATSVAYILNLYFAPRQRQPSAKSFHRNDTGLRKDCSFVRERVANLNDPTPQPMGGRAQENILSATTVRFILGPPKTGPARTQVIYLWRSQRRR